MKSLNLKTISRGSISELRISMVLFFAAVAVTLAGPLEMPLATPSPTPDENKNSTEIFEYETVYSFKSD